MHWWRGQIWVRWSGLTSLAVINQILAASRENTISDKFFHILDHACRKCVQRLDNEIGLIGWHCCKVSIHLMIMLVSLYRSGSIDCTFTTENSLSEQSSISLIMKPDNFVWNPGSNSRSARFTVESFSIASAVHSSSQVFTCPLSHADAAWGAYFASTLILKGLSIPKGFVSAMTFDLTENIFEYIEVFSMWTKEPRAIASWLLPYTVAMGKWI